MADGSVWGAVILSLFLMSSGLFLLVFCGDHLVSGAVKLAARLKVPIFFIGMTVVAFGTSAPELFVAITAVLNGDTALVFGNVIGSNICNILLVLGLPALLFTINGGDQNLTVGTLLMLASTCLFVVMTLHDRGISHGEAGVLLVLLAFFLLYSARQSGGDEDDEIQDMADDPLPFGLAETLGLTLVVILGASLGLALGAHLTVTHATLLSQYVPGVSPEIVGLTIVALGTSLPELATTMAAARRRHFSVGFGNILGSNIFNIHAIAGISALVAADGLEMATVGPGPGRASLEGDLLILIAASSIASYYIMGNEPRIDRLSGLLLFACYLLYIGYLLIPVLAPAGA